MDKYSVQIIDDETGITYTVSLSHEEYEKAATDTAFLRGILNAIKNGTTPLISPELINQQGLTKATENVTNTTAGDEHHASVEEPADSWTTEGTLSFIAEYEDLQEGIDKGKLKQKDAFEKISKNLQEKNYCVTAKQCATKLASLKRTYKKIKDHNNKSGNDRQTWQYFERMENIFSKKPWVQPVALCSSRSGEDLEQEATEEVPVSQSKRRRLSTSLDQKFDRLLELSERRREERAKQHAEKMERLDKLLEILEQRIN